MEKKKKRKVEREIVRRDNEVEFTELLRLKDPARFKNYNEADDAFRNAIVF